VSLPEEVSQWLRRRRKNPETEKAAE